MSDGQRSGKSTGRVSFKSTELKRCSMIEMRWKMRWNKYEVSLASIIIINTLSLVRVNTELSVGWVDPWVGLVWVDIFQFLVGWAGLVHYSKSTKNLSLTDKMTRIS